MESGFFPSYHCKFSQRICVYHIIVCITIKAPLHVVIFFTRHLENVLYRKSILKFSQYY